VLLDHELFKQALLNLMLNAEQAMPEGGEITLQTRSESDLVCLDIIDTGSGIEPEDLKKLFRPFHTTKPGGTGLGLATTRKIVEAHGGEISVQSAPGRGTKFTIRLPKVVEAIR
jgi:signal transduction histidine kinase